MVGAFAALARRLAPALVVLEDVDLVAQERTYGPFGSSPVLFELMNQMDGLDDDADIAFVLTTNRPDASSRRSPRARAVSTSPSSSELPDDEGRRRLLALYARGLDLELSDPEAVVRRTAGVTASFVKELLRRAALAAAGAGRTVSRTMTCRPRSTSSSPTRPRSRACCSAERARAMPFCPAARVARRLTPARPRPARRRVAAPCAGAGGLAANRPPWRAARKGGRFGHASPRASRSERSGRGRITRTSSSA